MYIGYVLQHSPEIRRPPYDGPATHVRHVVEELAARGHRVRVLARLEGKVWKSDDLEHFEPVRAASAGGAARLFESGVRRVQSLLHLPYAHLFESRRFAAIVRRELAGADLLYERMSWMGYGAGLAAKQMGIPLVFEFNGDHLHDLEAKGMAPKGLHKRLAVALMEAAVRRAAFTVASGRGWQAQFIKRYRVPPERIMTVENGTILVNLLKREDLRAFAPEEAGQPVRIVYLGGFYPWQGVEILLRAFARLRAGGAAAHLMLIGAGANQESCKQMVREGGMEADVTFTGQLGADRYAPVLAGAGIGVSPYCGWKEYSGMKLFDYKAAGLAIIASGENGQPDTLAHGRTGWIVPPCDEDALFQALERFTQDAALRCSLGQAARLDAEQNHSWGHTVDLLEDLFKRLVKAPRG